MRQIRLSSAEIDFWVDVCVYAHADRWLAVATISGDREIGLGTSPRQAVRNSLHPLGEWVANRLIADLGDPRI